MVLKVGIIGGGVIGFSCGVRIAEHYKTNTKVTIISEDFTPNTTGDGSAGLWGPYLLGKTCPKKVTKWSKSMHDFCLELWKSEEGGEAGICLLPVVRVTTEPEGLDSFWRNIVYGYKDLTREELDRYGKLHNKNYTAGGSFVTFTSEPIKLLPYLMKRYKNAGGDLLQQKVENLKEFVSKNDYDVVINCTGLGAQTIVPDKDVYPIRGQVMRVMAPWLYYSYLDESDDGNYIIPNCDSVVLGGTHQVRDYNITPYKEDTIFIKNGCENIVAGLKHAPLLKEWVGLRPGRDSMRLDSEISENGKMIIHNYGHGGCGVTLCWGCAEDVLDMIKAKSKL